MKKINFLLELIIFLVVVFFLTISYAFAGILSGVKKSVVNFWSDGVAPAWNDLKNKHDIN